jgi:hypothetical protein
MIRWSGFWRASPNAVVISTDGGGEFGKTEDPGFSKLTGPNWISAGDPTAGEFNEKTPTDSHKLRSLLCGYEPFEHLGLCRDLHRVW